MIKTRRDLSEWILHFVHRRNPENDPAYNLNEGEDTPLFPFHEDREKNARFELWDVVDGDSTLAADECEIFVLLKIIEDGHIRTGWSFRDGRPTIYGPRAACCFTEMPLYGLIDYAKRRANNAVGTFAIGLLRGELFTAGARPVIYGLSGQHREIGYATRGSQPYPEWPRKLAPECGISEVEQYRYVYTNLSGPRPIDWAHEREWRWADFTDECSCPGLPIWLQDEPREFSRVMVVVPTRDDAARVLDKLKELYDAGEHNYAFAYNRKTLAATYVVNLEDVASVVPQDQLETIRLDDLPGSTIQRFERPHVTTEFVDLVQAALKSAHIAAERAAKEQIAKANKDKKGFVLDGCGFAHLALYSPQSPVATALLELGEAHVIGGGGYRVSNFGKYKFGQQAMSVAEAAVEAACAEMERAFPDARFGVETRWD